MLRQTKHAADIAQLEYRTSDLPCVPILAYVLVYKPTTTPNSVQVFALANWLCPPLFDAHIRILSALKPRTINVVLLKCEPSHTESSQTKSKLKGQSKQRAEHKA